MVAQVAALDHLDTPSALTTAGTRPVAPGPVDDDLPDHDKAVAMKRRFESPQLPTGPTVPRWRRGAAGAARVFGDDLGAASATAERIFWIARRVMTPSVQMANQPGMQVATVLTGIATLA